MIAVGMGDHGPVNAPPGIDVKIAGRTIQAFVGKLDERHAASYAINMPAAGVNRQSSIVNGRFAFVFFFSILGDMFLQLNHQRLDVYTVSISLVQECYKLTQQFPADERFALCSQIRRAAVSVHLNIAEGCSRKSEAERKRFFEIARGSLIEIDAALDVAESLHYCQKAGLEELGTLLVRCFSLLSKLLA
jgi:four helix bundle protein